MKKTFITASVLAALLTGACEQQTQNETTQQTDTTARQTEQQTNQQTGLFKMDPQEFVKESANFNLYEIQMGKLAQEKAQNKEVKEFAKKMVNHHQNQMQELKKVANNYQVPQNLEEDKKSDINDLKEKTGADFDNRFMDMVIDSHEDAIERLSKATEDIKDSTLVKYTASTIPVAKSHLEKARELNQKLEQSGTAQGNEKNQMQGKAK